MKQLRKRTDDLMRIDFLNEKFWNILCFAGIVAKSWKFEEAGLYLSSIAFFILFIIWVYKVYQRNKYISFKKAISMVAASELYNNEKETFEKGFKITKEKYAIYILDDYIKNYGLILYGEEFYSNKTIIIDSREFDIQNINEDKTALLSSLNEPKYINIRIDRKKLGDLIKKPHSSLKCNTVKIGNAL